MQLILKGVAGVRVCDWKSYAMLRDNVQHFLESGVPDGGFEALHRIEQAVDTGECVVDASQLRAEILRAWCALWGVAVAQSAISPRTIAILTNSPVPPPELRTVKADEASCQLLIRTSPDCPVPRAAGKFVNGVLALTEWAARGDMIAVRRAGSGPSFVRANTL